MSAIVKANPNLTAGGYSVLRSALTFNDGNATLEVDLCVLEQFHARYARSFQKGAAPIAGTKVLQSLAATSPTLYDVNVVIEHGLCYFKAKYATQIDTATNADKASELSPSSDWTYTKEWDIKTLVLQATKKTTIPATNTIVTEVVSAQFDYISVTETSTSRGNANPPTVEGYVGQPFNTRNMSFLNIANVSYEVEPFSQSTIESASETINNRGEIIKTASSVGVYTIGKNGQRIRAFR